MSPDPAPSRPDDEPGGRSAPLAPGSAPPGPAFSAYEPPDYPPPGSPPPGPAFSLSQAAYLPGPAPDLRQPLLRRLLGWLGLRR